MPLTGELETRTAEGGMNPTMSHYLHRFTQVEIDGQQRHREEEQHPIEEMHG